MSAPLMPSRMWPRGPVGVTPPPRNKCSQHRGGDKRSNARVCILTLARVVRLCNRKCEDTPVRIGGYPSDEYPTFACSWLIITRCYQRYPPVFGMGRGVWTTVLRYSDVTRRRPVPVCPLNPTFLHLLVTRVHVEQFSYDPISTALS